MRHINALLNGSQYENLNTLLMEARDRAKDSILTCQALFGLYFDVFILF